MINIIYFIIRLRKNVFRKEFWELLKIRLKDRHKILNTKIFGFPFTVIDSVSFLGMYLEIYLKEIYKFKCAIDNPVIIDCGSNIGVSILFFKKIYPKSKIISFEADPKVFQVLQKNIRHSGFSNIQLNNEAVWCEDAKIKFKPDAADGGHLVVNTELSKIDLEVKTVSIRKYIIKKIDLLKIDIEGAEFEVLQNISDLLVNVERIFVEYHSFANEKQNLHLILDILNKAGFRYYLEQTTIFSKNPFFKINVSNELDNLINIFGYRENW